ncbi:unnamed protein product [Coccothraustes coccothraustes]
MRAAPRRRSGESQVPRSPRPSPTASPRPGQSERARPEGCGALPVPAGLPTASSPRLPRGEPQPRCVCLRAAEHKQKQLGPARLRPTPRLATGTHAPRGPGAPAVLATHVTEAPTTARALPQPPPATPGPSPRRPRPLSSAGFCSSPARPRAGTRPPLQGACFLLSSERPCPLSLSQQLGGEDRFPPSLPVLLPLESPPQFPREFPATVFKLNL